MKRIKISTKLKVEQKYYVSTTPNDKQISQRKLVYETHVPKADMLVLNEIDLTWKRRSIIRDVHTTFSLLQDGQWSVCYMVRINSQ
jgi:hypothetical protein